MAPPVNGELDAAQYSAILSGQVLLEGSLLADNLVTRGSSADPNVKREAERFIATRADYHIPLGGIVSVRCKPGDKPPKCKFAPPEGVRYTRNSYHGGDITFAPAECPVIGRNSCVLTRQRQDLDKEWQLDCKVLLHG